MLGVFKVPARAADIDLVVTDIGLASLGFAQNMLPVRHGNI